MSNPQAKAINQKRGPTTGNAGNATKRKDFMEAKSTSSSEKSKLADMVIGALENRGQRQRGKDDPAVESLKSTVGKATNPTANGSKLPAKYKK